jgi:hypothetical protein
MHYADIHSRGGLADTFGNVRAHFLDISPFPRSSLFAPKLARPDTASTLEFNDYFNRKSNYIKRVGTSQEYKEPQLV